MSGVWKKGAQAAGKLCVIWLSWLIGSEVEGLIEQAPSSFSIVIDCDAGQCSLQMFWSQVRFCTSVYCPLMAGQCYDITWTGAQPGQDLH